jgi:hypothetical protein
MITYKYNSMSEFGAAVASLPPRHGKARDSSIATPARMCSDFTQKAAIDTAKKGGLWPEGARNLMAVTLNDSDFAQDGPLHRLNSAVTGFAPLVPAYLSGLPDSMLAINSDIVSRKIIKIGVQVGRSYNIEQQESLNRGRAILSCIDAIENQGYSVELWAIWRNIGDGNNAPKSDIQVRIKASDEAYTPASAAFALCSTAFQRRLCWRVIESCPKGYRLSSKKHRYGYGSKDMSDFDIGLRYFDDGDQHRTPKSSLRTIEREFNKQLEALKNG